MGNRVKNVKCVLSKHRLLCAFSEPECGPRSIQIISVLGLLIVISIEFIRVYFSISGFSVSVMNILPTFIIFLDFFWFIDGEL